MLKQDILALCAVTGMFMGGWTPNASAQVCDDRYPIACRGVGGPPSQAPQYGTPSAPQVIVPQALPTFKRFVTTMANSRKRSSESGHSQTDIQLLGCLRRFLSIYLHAQKREAPASLSCVKNCLMGITILFTGGGNRLSAVEPLVARFLEEVVDCLTDRMVCPCPLFHHHTYTTN